MIDVGVSDIAIYIPQFYLPHDELAERGESARRSSARVWEITRWPFSRTGRIP